jgi:murein DD-endopeptidase MepM/ murein hydrolase activator NlpD
MALRMATFLTAVLLLAPVVPATADGKPYTVVEGDTFYAISKRLQVPVAILQSVNGIADPSKLRPGMVLKVPSVHEVKKGETLYGIARDAGVKLDDLLALNALKATSVIKQGDLLILPAGARTTTAGTAAGTTAATTRLLDASKPVPAGGSMIWPHAGTRSPFQGRVLGSGSLQGIAFTGSRGDPVFSATSGEVKWAAPYFIYGKTVLIKTGDGHLLLYAGNEELMVRVGDLVTPGMEIARLGASPQGGGARLIFSVHGRAGEYVDPEKYLAKG